MSGGFASLGADLKREMELTKIWIGQIAEALGDRYDYNEAPILSIAKACDDADRYEMALKHIASLTARRWWMWRIHATAARALEHKS